MCTTIVCWQRRSPFRIGCCPYRAPHCFTLSIRLLSVFSTRDGAIGPVASAEPVAKFLGMHRSHRPSLLVRFSERACACACRIPSGRIMLNGIYCHLLRALDYISLCAVEEEAIYLAINQTAIFGTTLHKNANLRIFKGLCVAVHAQRRWRDLVAMTVENVAKWCPFSYSRNAKPTRLSPA